LPTSNWAAAKLPWTSTHRRADWRRSSVNTLRKQVG